VRTILAIMLALGGCDGGGEGDADDAPDSSDAGDRGDNCAQPAGPGCGDGVCAADENADTCRVDCGVCTDGATVRMETGGAAGVPGAGFTPGGMADTHAVFAGGRSRSWCFP